ncbi:MAG: hypothetical protein RXS42_07205 [Nitrososphaeria archaeon]
MAELVGRYYATFYARRGYRELLESMMRRVAEEHWEVSADAARLIRLYAAGGILDGLLNCVKDALSDIIVYREFSVMYGEEPDGFLDVARTIPIYPSGMVAYLTYNPTNRSPEYAMLRHIVEEALSIWSNHVNVGVGSDPMLEFLGLEGDLKNFQDTARELAERKEELPRYPGTSEDLEREARRLEPYAPQWFREALELRDLMRALEEQPAAAARSEDVEMRAVLLGWKLYELLAFYLVASALLEDGYEEESSQGEVRLGKGGRSVALIHGAPLEGSAVKGTVPPDIVAPESLRGRPDISLEGGEVRAVMDAKLSFRPSYATLGRFKVMAYMYEYGADYGVLVIPGIDRRRLYDEEEDSTYRLYEWAKEYGYAGIAIESGGRERRLYVLVLDPLEDHSILRERVNRLLGEMGLVGYRCPRAIPQRYEAAGDCVPMDARPLRRPESLRAGEPLSALSIGWERILLARGAGPLTRPSKFRRVRRGSGEGMPHGSAEGFITRICKIPGVRCDRTQPSVYVTRGRRKRLRPGPF